MKIKYTPFVAACALQRHATTLVASVRFIIENWQRGDLAGAVNLAETVANQADQVISTTQTEAPIKQLVSASERLLTAYARGEVNGGEMDWEDVDLAHEAISAALDVIHGRRPGQSQRLALRAVRA